MSTIFAVDPGPIDSAYCIWDGETIIEHDKVKNAALLPMIEGTSDDVSADTVVACEHIQCMGMPVGAAVFETAYWIGHLRGWCAKHKVLFLPVYRSEVKMFWCGNMRAKDGNIRQAVIDRLGAPGTKKSQGATYGVSGDQWSALAIAVMVYDKTNQHPDNP